MRFTDTAAVQGQPGAIGLGKPALTAVFGPGLAVAHPVFALFTAVFDVRRAVAQVFRAAFGPQVSR